MRSSGFSAAEKSAVTAACQHLIDRLPEAPLPAHHPADAVQLWRASRWQQPTLG
jgi:hypothetical protein